MTEKFFWPARWRRIAKSPGRNEFLRPTVTYGEIVAFVVAECTSVLVSVGPLVSLTAATASLGGSVFLLGSSARSTRCTTVDPDLTHGFLIVQPVIEPGTQSPFVSVYVQLTLTSSGPRL